MGKKRGNPRFMDIKRGKFYEYSTFCGQETWHFPRFMDKKRGIPRFMDIKRGIPRFVGIKRGTKFV